MKSLGSPAAVAAAVREDAEAEVERITKENRAALARLGEEDAAGPVALPGRDVRLAAAHREAHALLAQEDLLDAREALELREAWLRKAVTAGARLLDEPVPIAERRALLARLAREGLDRLPGAAIDVIVAPADAALLDAAWARDLAPDRSARVVSSAEVTPGGCVVRSADGKVAYDNTREARARRFHGAIRSALGAIYRSAGAGIDRGLGGAP